MRAALLVAWCSLLAGCASTPETHGRWYVGVLIVAAYAAAGYILVIRYRWTRGRRVKRADADETDQAGA